MGRGAVCELGWLHQTLQQGDTGVSPVLTKIVRRLEHGMYEEMLREIDQLRD